MPIVFGSPEAMAILKEDRFQRLIEDDETIATLVVQLDALNESIEETEGELNILLEERWRVQQKLRKLKEGKTP